MDPDRVSERLGVAPTHVQRQGDLTKSGAVIRLNGWFLSSKDQVDSRDVRRHIDFVLAQVLPVGDSLRSLLRSGVRGDISCYWVSYRGQGGPCISPRQARSLADLGLDCGFDIYWTG